MANMTENSHGKKRKKRLHRGRTTVTVLLMAKECLAACGELASA